MSAYRHTHFLGGDEAWHEPVFFHIRDGLIFVPDDEGMECRNMQAVEEEACASARDMVEAAIASRLGRTPPTIEVEDDEGNEVSCTNRAAYFH